MPKLILLIFILSIFGSSVCQSQSPTEPPPYSGTLPQQSVYLEFGGNGIIYSLNYDVLFENNWGLRLGGSYYPFENENRRNTSVQTDIFTGLVMGYRTLGKTAHKLEVGGGFVFGTFNESDMNVPRPPGATASIGYRYYPPQHSHLTFKVAFTPMANSSGLYPRMGISIGITLTPEGNAEWP